MITYNGVTFVCDEKTNSICLGNMDDKKNVLNIPLSGGGHLKVHRDNLGDLAKAIGMFSPEDVNRILRAIHQDTKIQSMEQELEDMENSVGEVEEQPRADKEEVWRKRKNTYTPSRAGKLTDPVAWEGVFL